MAESDDPVTETDDESPVIRAKHTRKTPKTHTVECLRRLCQDPARISSEEFSRALAPQRYRRYIRSQILLPRTWSRDLEPKYRKVTNRLKYFPYNREVYKLATHTDPQRECPLLHIVPNPSILQSRVIDWPCGCVSPKLSHSLVTEQVALAAANSARKWPPAPTHVLLFALSTSDLFHVPTRPAIRRKRKGSQRLSLTDRKRYKIGDNSANKDDN